MYAIAWQKAYSVCGFCQPLLRLQAMERIINIILTNYHGKSTKPPPSSTENRTLFFSFQLYSY